MPSLKRVIGAMLAALPAIANSLIVLSLFLFLFALPSTMLWSGTFHYRCRDDTSGTWVDEDTLCYPAASTASSASCEQLTVLNNPYTCETGESCLGYHGRSNDDGDDGSGGTSGEGAPESGNINFDNALYSLLTLFAVSTMEGWSGILYYTQDAMAEWTFLIFLAIIVVGNFTVINLMIAAILVRGMRIPRLPSGHDCLNRNSLILSASLGLAPADSVFVFIFSDEISYLPAALLCSFRCSWTELQSERRWQRQRLRQRKRFLTPLN
jgi:hypothetical protein